MFENLNAEMARQSLTIKDIEKDKKLNLSYPTLRSKFKGKTQWKRNEMFHIKREYFPNKSIEYLFEQK